jgi:hypothetical protein
VLQNLLGNRCVRKVQTLLSVLEKVSRNSWLRVIRNKVSGLYKWGRGEWYGCDYRLIVSSIAAGWKRGALVVKQVSGRELHSEDYQPVVVRVCDKIRKLVGIWTIRSYTQKYGTVLLLHASRRKILNVAHLSSTMSCCMNEVVEKGRVVQISEDRCILVV